MVDETKKITQADWNAMSNEQRFDYLSADEITIKKQTGLRPDAKVGDVSNMFVTHFCATCRDSDLFALRTHDLLAPHKVTKK